MESFNPQQLQELVLQARRQAEALQQKLQATVVEASAGGGVVRIKMNGLKRLLEIKIDPEAARAGDLEMLQDLITAAANEAARKVDAEIGSSVGGLLGGFNLPQP